MNVSLAEDNFLACGNAAGAGTPAVGEGFRIALEMAQSAYDTINIAFDKSDFSRKTLIVHEQNFNLKFGKYYNYSRIIRFFVMNIFTSREYALFAKNMARLSPEESRQVLISKITIGFFFKILDVPFASYLFLNLVKFLIGGCKPLNKQTYGKS